VQIDVLAPTGVSIAETVEFARRAESAGAHGVGVPDHLEHGRDGFLALALAAQATSRAQLYPAVTNVLTRHPFQIAVFARSMQEIAPGRSKLVLGAGASTAEHTGQPPASRERLREVVPLIKALLRGEAVAFGTSPSERIDDPDSPGPSVHLAASGPKAVRLAGEVGDGALLFMGISKPIRVLGAALIAEGWAAAKRQNPAFEVTFNTLMSVDDDPVAARERTRRAAHSWLKLRRFDAGFAEVGLRFEVSERAEDLPDDVLEAVCEHCFIVGTPADCVAKLRALADEGLERLLVMPAGGPARNERVFHVLAEVSVPA
jgi:5,10-methylenetetrahydromethanopterin reductase